MMKWLIALLATPITLLVSVTPAFAAATFYAEGPASASVGAEVSIDVRLRMTEPINAVKTRIHMDPGSVHIDGFDDSDSAVRLWLQRGVPEEGGLILEGVIPGGVGPAFSDSISLGKVRIRPTSDGVVRISFSDSQVYLNQPIPTLSTVDSKTLSVPVHTGGDAGASVNTYAKVVDADVRIVRDEELFDGKRTLIFDVKTDHGTADKVLIRERWLGLFGTWREAVNPSTLSDSMGVSILDVRLPESSGGAYVASVTPGTLLAVWLVLALIVLYAVRHIIMKRR